MDDLISRQIAIDSLTEIIMNLKNVYGDMGSAINGAQECIKSLPSIEPERKKWKKGKWIVTSEFEDCRYAKCNQCKVIQVFYYNKPLTNFCPNCGAEMREEHKDIPMEYFENVGI